MKKLKNSCKILLINLGIQQVNRKESQRHNILLAIANKNYCEKPQNKEHIDNINIDDKENKKENKEIKNNKTIKQNENPTKKESLYRRAWKNLQKYGLKGLIVYYVFYLAGLGIIYCLIENKYIDSISFLNLISSLFKY